MWVRPRGRWAGDHPRPASCAPALVALPRIGAFTRPEFGVRSWVHQVALVSTFASLWALMSLCAERIRVQQVLYPADEAPNPGDELSCLGEEAQHPHRREERDLPSGSKRPKTPGPRSGPGTAWSLALPLLVHFPQPWASHLENGDKDTYQQDVIKTGPKGEQARPQCLPRLPPGQQHGEGAGSTREELTLNGGRRGRGCEVQPAPLPSHPQAPGRWRTTALRLSTRKMAATTAHPRSTS